MVKLDIEITGTGNHIRVKCALFHIGTLRMNESDCAIELIKVVEARVHELIRKPQDTKGE